MRAFEGRIKKRITPVRDGNRYNCFNIKERLEKMAANRKFAKLDISEDKIVYRDTVRGLSDVARYLRGFGRSCKVNKPEKLKQMMIESNDKVIEMYEEYLNKNT